ncbi:MAG: hypothetical protein ACYTBJ_04940 [Planctomycetota bacterium]
MAAQAQNLSRETACAYLAGTAAIVALLMSRILYKSARFMQNKPNFRKAKMNVNFCPTKAYENENASGPRENKPNQTQFQTPRELMDTDQNNPVTLGRAGPDACRNAGSVSIFSAGLSAQNQPMTENAPIYRPADRHLADKTPFFIGETKTTRNGLFRPFDESINIQVAAEASGNRVARNKNLPNTCSGHQESGQKSA